MQVTTFFKLLNRKIEQYNKIAKNPFMQPQSIVIVWVEEPTKEEKEDI